MTACIESTPKNKPSIDFISLAHPNYQARFAGRSHRL